MVIVARGNKSEWRTGWIVSITQQIICPELLIYAKRLLTSGIDLAMKSRMKYLEEFGYVIHNECGHECVKLECNNPWSQVRK